MANETVDTNELFEPRWVKNTNQLPYFFRYLFPFFIFHLSFDLKIEISSSYLN